MCVYKSVSRTDLTSANSWLKNLLESTHGEINDCWCLKTTWHASQLVKNNIHRLTRFWKRSLVITVKRNFKSVVEKEALGSHLERYFILTSSSQFYCLYEFYNDNNISERPFLLYSLFIASAVLFTVVDLLFYLELLFTTSQYRLERIHANKHKTTLQQFFSILQCLSPTIQQTHCSSVFRIFEV